MRSMIGVFDSGYGGLTVLRSLVDKLPEYSYYYLGDNAREPYGPHPEDKIYEWTRQGVEFLFSKGCKLVILACNTASAGALKRLQEDLIKPKYQDHRILGILVPTIEELTGLPWGSPVAVRTFGEDQKVVAVLGTEATIRSKAYSKEIAKRNPNIVVFEQACPQLTTLIVAEGSDEAMREAIKLYLGELQQKMKQAGYNEPPNSVVLGCTHYALIKNLFADELPKIVELIAQDDILVKSLECYLRRNPEIDEQLDRRGERQFFTTGDPDTVTRLGSNFFGEPVVFTKVQIDNLQK